MFRQVIDSLLPKGSLWIPRVNCGLDNLLNGISDVSDKTVAMIDSVSKVRHPLHTTVLSDLEIDYGIKPDATVNETTRRLRLQSIKNADTSDGTAEWLQSTLRAAGFDIYVHVNNPPVDPLLFLEYDASVLFGEPGNQFGTSPDQFIAINNTDPLVNGLLYYNQLPVSYPLPVNPVYWSLMWFIGGQASRNAGGELTGISFAQVPINRKTEFIGLLVKYKPMHTWAGLKIEYV